MNWTRIPLLLSDSLSIILIIRLLALRLHDVYRVFCAFLFFEAFSESFVIVYKLWNLERYLDYRSLWLFLQVGSWLLSIWMVYSLLQAILRSLPGILHFLKRVLNVVLPFTVLIALLSAGPEYVASGASRASSRMEYIVRVAFVLDRLISTVAVLTLLLTLMFVLWFPVAMPRNLAVFSIGFTIYFTAKTLLFLLHSFWSHEMLPFLDKGLAVILGLCFAYWIAFLNKRGETAAVTLGHSWQAAKQTQLVNDLENMNAALSRAAHR